MTCEFATLTTENGVYRLLNLPDWTNQDTRNLAAANAVEDVFEEMKRDGRPIRYVKIGTWHWSESGYNCLIRGRFYPRGYHPFPPVKPSIDVQIQH